MANNLGRNGKNYRPWSVAMTQSNSFKNVVKPEGEAPPTTN